MNGARRLHAWQIFHAIDNLLEHRDTRLRWPQAQEQSHGDRPRRLKAEIDAHQARKRSQQQAGADQQHHRERDFGDDERAAQMR